MPDSADSTERIDSTHDFSRGSPGTAGSRLGSQPHNTDDHPASSSEQNAAMLKVILLEKCQRIYNLRRDRDKIFGDQGLFADPAWDILLDLFLKHLQGHRVSKTSAALASCTPLTTALRWISILEAKGIVRHEQDAKDGRRTYVALTKVGIEGMERAITLL